MVEPLLSDSQAKLWAAFELVFASTSASRLFVAGRMDSPQKREPHDALVDRVLRAQPAGAVDGRWP